MLSDETIKKFKAAAARGKLTRKSQYKLADAIAEAGISYSETAYRAKISPEHIFKIVMDGVICRKAAVNNICMVLGIDPGEMEYEHIPKSYTGGNRQCKWMTKDGSL